MPMDRDTKRALLASALVCPGLGQWRVGKRGLGAAMMAWAVAFVFLLAWRIFVLLRGYYLELTNEMLETGAMVPDLSSFNEIHAQVYITNWWVILAIVVVWIWSVWDLYPRKKG